MYTIKRGDTLSGIAKANNTTIDELMQLNPYITNPNTIYAGKTLNLSAQPQVQPQVPNNPYGIYNDQFSQIQQNREQQDLWMGEQRRIQEEQINRGVDYQTQLIEQQKQRANEDLAREGNAAQVDYMKSLNPYGVEREQQVQAGLGNTGYSESTRTQHYNTMQNRVSNAINTTARIKADFDNKMTEARMNGDKLKAELALEEYNQKIATMWQTLELEIGIKDKIVEQKRWEDQFAYQKQQDAIANAQRQSQINLKKQYELDTHQSLSKGGEEFMTFMRKYEASQKGNPELPNGVLTPTQLESTLKSWYKQGKINADDIKLIIQEYGYN